MHVSFCTFLSVSLCVYVFVSLWYLVVAFEWNRVQLKLDELMMIIILYFFVNSYDIRWNILITSMFMFIYQISWYSITLFVILFSTRKWKKKKKFLRNFVLNSSLWWYKAPAGFFKIPFLMFPAKKIFKNDQSCNPVRHIFMQNIYNAKYFEMGQPEKCYLCFKHKEQTRRKEGKTDRALHSSHHVYL